MDWMMTFSPKAPFRLVALDTPTAMMAIGMAASNTCPTFSPRKAAAAEKIIAMMIPHETDRKLTSGYSLSGDINGSYFSPGFNGRNAFSGSPTCFSSSSFMCVFNYKCE